MDHGPYLLKQSRCYKRWLAAPCSPEKVASGHPCRITSFIESTRRPRKGLQLVPYRRPLRLDSSLFITNRPPSLPLIDLCPYLHYTVFHCNPFQPHAGTMSNSLEKPWSNNFNAPQIPSRLYTEEKNVLAGSLIGAMLYGTPTRVISIFTYPAC